jgi:hypothetical protein
MSDHVQIKLKYAFADEKLPLLALSSAHRDRDEKSQHDVNKGLAHYEALAIEMAKTYDAILKRGRTLRKLLLGFQQGC